MAVNEADYTSVIVWTVGGQKCEVIMVVWSWCCSAHTGNEVSSSVWRNGCEGVVCILALWKPCGFCGIVPVDFW